MAEHGMAPALFFQLTKQNKKCRHPESHRGYRRHKPGYCSYTIAAEGSGGSGYRSRFSTLRRLYATMYNNPPSCVHRDSNPNLILGRDKYYPCTMDAFELVPTAPGVGPYTRKGNKNKKRARHQPDSNRRGQSPLDFESNALTTRP